MYFVVNEKYEERSIFIDFINNKIIPNKETSGRKCHEKYYLGDERR